MLGIKILAIFTLLFAAGMTMWHNWRARELAERLARDSCRRLGVQLLDETVGQKGWRIVREQGRWMLRRTYGFEFSRNGADRWPGELILLGGRLAGMEFNLVDPHAPRPVKPSTQPEPPPTASASQDKVIPIRRKP